MHELGVVFHTLDTVKRIADENNVKRVASITVEIGEVSTVIPELFEDCWNWAVKKNMEHWSMEGYVHTAVARILI